MVDEYLVRLENHLKDIKSLLQTIAGGAPTASTLESLGVVPKPATIASRSNEFDELKKLLLDPSWPLAVDPEMICDDSNEGDRKTRAEGIVDFMIEEPVSDKKFLDFGCGEGLCVFEAVRKGAELGVGYDIKQGWISDSLEFSGRQAYLTTSFDEVKSRGPYDVIFVYDVLDHATGATQKDIMNMIKSVSTTETRIYVRCHPWCSRTATHTYKQLNKAYTHLVFSESELIRLGIEPGEKTHQVIHPHMEYKSWFNETGFEVVEEHPIPEDVESFFKEHPVITSRISKHWASSHDDRLSRGETFPDYQLTIQFVDYVLRLS